MISRAKNNAVDFGGAMQPREGLWLEILAKSDEQGQSLVNPLGEALLEEPKE